MFYSLEENEKKTKNTNTKTLKNTYRCVAVELSVVPGTTLQNNDVKTIYEPCSRVEL